MTSINNTQDTPQVGASLRVIRRGAGLKAVELAEQVNVSESTISRFESGARDISPALLARIAAVIASALVEKRAS